MRDESSKTETQIAERTAQIKRFEDFLDRGVPAEDRGQIEREVEMFKGQLATIEKRRQDLANEEAQLSQQISSDQGRWTDVNNQLDQLERALMPMKQ